jgi:hypothetical protein
VKYEFKSPRAPRGFKSPHVPNVTTRLNPNA